MVGRIRTRIASADSQTRRYDRYHRRVDIETQFKKAWPLERALEFIRDSRGRHFGPEFVEYFPRRLP